VAGAAGTGARTSSAHTIARVRGSRTMSSVSSRASSSPFCDRCFSIASKRASMCDWSSARGVCHHPAGAHAGVCDDGRDSGFISH